MPDIEEQIEEILQGSVDFHMHSHMSPGYHWDLAEIGRRCMSAGMRAVVVKNLYGFSHEQCHTANKLIGKNIFYASLVFGKTTGNVNEASVEQFSQFGETNKIVEMPVFDSFRHMMYLGKPADSGIKVIDNGKPVACLIEVLEIIARKNLVLKTGHISPQESIALIRIAKEVGVQNIVVTHATGTPVMATVKQQEEMASMGAFIEHCIVKFLPLSIWRSNKNIDHYHPEAPIGDLNYLKESIKTIGPERCVLGTDSGQVYHPYPHELFKYFIALLLDMEFSFEEVKKMAGENSCRLLGIKA